MDYLEHLQKILRKAIEEKASDLLISAHNVPIVRVTGQLIALKTEKTVTPEEAKGMAMSLMNEAYKSKLALEREVDFSYDFEDEVRFRVNVYFQRGNVNLALRLIPSKIKTVEELLLPAVLHEFTKKSQGLVLITGASGQGKSTTLAALIDEINHTRAVHIITIEDPIEYIYKNDKAVIDQREVPSDTNSFSSALRASFRQNPDVIMVGEMRDLETISAAITAAETGHLVFATLHTNSASQSIHRIIDVFASGQQNQIRFQLAGSLVGVVSERLFPRLQGGFIPACEVLFSNAAVANLIRENKMHEIPAVIETSFREGMISFNRSLTDLISRNEIARTHALEYSVNPLKVRNF